MNTAKVETVDRWAAVIIFVTSIVGVVLNTFIGLYIHRLSMLRNSFGRLLQLQAIGDAIFVSVWAFYFAPTLFFNITPLQDLAIASRFGQLCLICYDISIYTHLIISFNRFISLYFPTQYAIIFTDRFTNVLIFGTVTVSFTFSWFLVLVNCVMGFSIPHWMLDYQIENCNMMNVYYAEFMRGLFVIGIFFVVNSLTLFKMHFHNKRKKGTSAFETTQQIKRRAVEKAFVQQVFMQGAIYVTELITYFFVAKYFPVDNLNIANDKNRWPNFLLTTYAWILVHTLDGVVTLIFNRQFRQVFTGFFHSKSAQNLSKTPSHLAPSGQSHRTRTTSSQYGSIKTDATQVRLNNIEEAEIVYEF